MDMAACTHQPIPNPQPAPATPAAAPQEATGDSESDDAAVSASAPTVGDGRPSSVAAGYAEDDAESCSGAGGGGNSCVDDDEDDDGRGADDVYHVAVECDENEVDSRMCVTWWRRTVQDATAGAGAGGGCARPQVAAESGPAVAVAGASHAAESNKLFWEACIAHGY